MDVQMPVMNGYEATRTIRKLKNTQLAAIPILAMTANAFEEDKQEALKSGMNGHIAKPINIDNLINTLKRVTLKRGTTPLFNAYNTMPAYCRAYSICPFFARAPHVSPPPKSAPPSSTTIRSQNLQLLMRWEI